MIDTNELFELCKRVYEATGWKTEYEVHNLEGAPATMKWNEHIERGLTSLPPFPVPLYNSDYLLQKLPDHIKIDGRKQGLRMMRRVMEIENSVYQRYSFRYSRQYEAEADTPLKTLLKLCLKLDQEKLL